MSFDAQNTLIVPMGLKAMVMPASDQNGMQGWDLQQMDYEQINRFKSPVPALFNPSDHIPRTGVHLYWTLPRALTRALTQQEVDTATSAGAPVTPDQTAFPLVPNRWMVLRIQQDPGGGAATVAAWIINADEHTKHPGAAAFVDPFNLDAGNIVNPIGLGVARNFDDWVSLAQGDGFANLPPRPFLTAMGPGTGTFNAFTPGANNVFSFCDPLGDGDATIDTATLDYAVVGWFSDASADPINPANPLNANGVGWTPVDTAALPDTLPDTARAEANGLSWLARLGWAAQLDNTAAPERTLLQALIARVDWNRTAPLPTPPEFQDFADTSSNVRVALANTSAEGLSAMVYDAQKPADGSFDPDAARTAMELEALQYRALRYLDEPAGRHLLAERIKEATYSREAGGYMWEVLGTDSDTPLPPLSAAQAETLTALNQSQRALDENRDVLHSMQMRLFDLWWQQENIAQGNNQPAPTSPGFFQLYQHARDMLLVPDGAALSAPVAGYLDQVVAQEGVVAQLAAQIPATDDADQIAAYAAQFLDTDTQQLACVKRPDFFAPTDPVVVVAGAGRLSDPQPQFVACKRATGTAQTTASADVVPEAALEFYAAADTGTAATGAPTWEQPWAPLYLDWQVTYNYAYVPGAVSGAVAIGEDGHYLIDQDAWAFNGRDYDWVGGTLDAAGGSLQTKLAHSYSGRTFFSPHAKSTFSRQLSQLAKDHGDAIPQATSDAINAWSLISQNTSGLTQLLTMRDTRANVGPGSAVSDHVPQALQGVPAPSMNPTPQLGTNDTGKPFFFPLRAGFLSFSNLQLTDSFGRTMNLMSANNGSAQQNPILKPVLPPALTPPAAAQLSSKGMAMMAPRLVQPARLDLRLVDADDDATDTTLSAEANPICGWLLPNHADNSLAVYDQGGTALGALQPYLQSDGSAVLQWVPPPGGDAAPGAFTTTPDISNTHLAGLVTGVLSASDPAGAMQDLMRTLDQAAWTLDPGDDRARGGLTALMGRPVAVVRANLQLQLKGLTLASQSIEHLFAPGTDTLLFSDGGVSDLSFDITLGARSLRRDGIAGYYADDTYACLRAVHKPGETTSGYITQQGADTTGTDTGGGWLTLSPVATPRNSTGAMNTDGARYVTLLVDPRGDMHLTSGVVPRLRARLPDQPVADALSQMALSLQVGPVLLDPGTIKMPLPSVNGGAWAWQHAIGTQAGDWQTDPVQSSDALARPTARAPGLHDGWLVLSAEDDPET